VILYHATLKSNLDSITAKGIDPSYSRGETEKVIWLHTPSRRERSILHVMQRHNATRSEIVIVIAPTT
jgi:hypothetical protein